MTPAHPEPVAPTGQEARRRRRRRGAILVVACAVLGGGLVASALHGAGAGQPSSSGADDACPPWTLRLDDSLRRSTPERVVEALAGDAIQVRDVRSESPSIRDVDVADERGRPGTYTVVRVEGEWAVTGGRGCGATTGAPPGEGSCPPAELPTPQPGVPVETICFG